MRPARSRLIVAAIALAAGAAALAPAARIASLLALPAAWGMISCATLAASCLALAFAHRK